MEDKDAVIKDLKAELYDVSKQAQFFLNTLNSIGKTLKLEEGSAFSEIQVKIEELMAKPSKSKKNS